SPASRTSIRRSMPRWRATHSLVTSGTLLLVRLIARFRTQRWFVMIISEQPLDAYVAADLVGSERNHVVSPPLIAAGVPISRAVSFEPSAVSQRMACER